MKLPVWRRNTARPLTLRLNAATLTTYIGVLALLCVVGGVIGYAVGARTASRWRP